MAEEPKDAQPAATIPDDLDLDLDLGATEDPEVLREQATKATTFAKQAIARAKKAEDENRVLKTPKDTPPPTPPASPQPNVEETVLLANGMPEELLGELKAIAAVRNVSLIKAQKDPIFVAMKENFEKGQKAAEAALPASRGSGSAKPKTDFTTPNLPREDHKAMAMKAMADL